jgi:hypothetical protein
MPSKPPALPEGVAYQVSKLIMQASAATVFILHDEEDTELLIRSHGKVRLSCEMTKSGTNASVRIMANIQGDRFLLSISALRLDYHVL